MTKINGLKLLNSIHPNFFEQDYVRNMPEEIYCEEMIMDLKDFNEDTYKKELDSNISFKFYDGDLNKLREEVSKVNKHWQVFFTNKQRIYCGYLNDTLVSFCIVDDMGIHYIDGKRYKIGGPGCVGTIPQYRKLGIGLTMVKNVTKILKDEGYDISYIHYTGVSDWYKKLGYVTSLRWNRNGQEKKK